MNYFIEEINKKDKEYKKMFKELEPIRTDHIKIYKKLNDKELEIIRLYKTNGYLQINDFLYNNKIEPFNQLDYTKDINIGSIDSVIENKHNELLDYVKILENIIDKYKLKKKITVFRGFQGDLINKFKKLKIGNEITFDSFTSTSINPSIAFRFSFSQNKKSKNKDKYLIEIKIPNGISILYLQWNIISRETKQKKKILNESFLFSEFEILLQRGCVFRLDKISTIEERFFTLDDMSWKKYMNTKNKVKKINVYHMSLIRIDKKELPNLDIVNKNINWNSIFNNFTGKQLLKNIYYIPQKQQKYFNNSITYNKIKNNKVKNKSNIK